MNRPPITGRWRRRLGFVMVITGAVLTVLFGVSAWWWFGYGNKSSVVDLGDGTLYTNSIPPEGGAVALVGWCGGANDYYSQSGAQRSWTWTWWTWGKHPDSWRLGNAYTVWPLAPIFLGCGAALALPGLRAANRVRRNRCAGCGYSREGLAPGNPCPECGAAVA